MKTDFLRQYLKEKNIENSLISGECRIKIDSRIIESGDIFLAIRGEKNNANDFIPQVFEKGAQAVITDMAEIKAVHGDRAVLVHDSLEFLQDFSHYYRKMLNPKVFSITGSNGKTTTKDILFSILSKEMKGKKTTGNLNNHIGVPLTLLTLEEDDKFIVVEMGMSDIGEIEFLCKLAEPDIGIITNIGDSHMEYLKSRDKVFEAKTEMLKFLKAPPVLNGEDDYFNNADGMKAGFSRTNDIYAEEIRIDEKGSRFILVDGDTRREAFINIPGEHNILDALLAAGAAKTAGITMETIIKGFENVEFTKMRFQEIKIAEDIYINDAYNASPVSMAFSLETFAKVYNDGRLKAAVLGDMLELGDESAGYHTALKDKILKTGISRLFLFGKEMEALYNVIKTEIPTFHSLDRDEIAIKLSDLTEKKVILLKGSRGMQLEKIIPKQL